MPAPRAPIALCCTALLVVGGLLGIIPIIGQLATQGNFGPISRPLKPRVSEKEQVAYKVQGNSVPARYSQDHPVTKDNIGDFTFIVNVLTPLTQTHICTGVLLSPNVVATPAACVDKVKKNSEPFPLVRVGSYLLNRHDGPEREEMARVCRCTVHRNFTGDPAKGGDIALLVLHKKFKSHAPVKGVKNIDDCQERMLFMVGWFASSQVGAPPNGLELLSNLTHVANQDCRRGSHQMPWSTVCAGVEGRPGCKWDLGAPLLCSDSHLIGLASHVANECGHSPYVYTYVWHLWDWIESNGKGLSIVTKNPHSDCDGLPDIVK